MRSGGLSSVKHFQFHFCLVCDKSGDNCCEKERFNLTPLFLCIQFKGFIPIISGSLPTSISTRTSCKLQENLRDVRVLYNL